MGSWLSTNEESDVEDEVTGDPQYLPAGYETSMKQSKNHCAVDAMESELRRPVINFTGLITIDKVSCIENDLEFYEKVSLVYLLYDDVEIALQYLIQLQQGAHLKVLEEWAKCSIKTKHWQEELVEALCIIQNYQILSKLGLNVKDQIAQFLPLTRDVSLFVNLTRKRMYCIFDDMDKKEIETFLELVKKDFHKESLHFRTFKSRYVELYLLYFMSVKYISPTNFYNVIIIFKMMEKYEVSDYIKSFSNSQSSLQNQNNIIQEINNVPINSYRVDQIEAESNRSTSRLFQTFGPSTTQDYIPNNCNFEIYDINPEYPGVCLIINQEVFYTEPDRSLRHLLPPTNKQLTRREGTNVDRDYLMQTFKSFKFNVIVENNLDHSSMLDQIKFTTKCFKDESSLIICILSHGIEGKVYGCNSIPVEVSEIRNIMCKSNTQFLKRKPKVLILQSCQGTECQKVEENYECDGPTSSSPSAVPYTADLLVFWATVPGYGAIRDRKNGTWFIQSLCKTIEERANEKHFEEICTLVKNEVIDKRWHLDADERAMVPIQESTLSKFFYLPRRVN